jgi:hypothetical protein
MPRRGATGHTIPKRAKRRSAKGVVEIVAKNELQVLVKAAASVAAAHPLPLDKLRGLAFYDTDRDALINSLSPFDGATPGMPPSFTTNLNNDETTKLHFDEIVNQP